jgi:urea transport system substrate-binding protein
MSRKIALLLLVGVPLIAGGLYLASGRLARAEPIRVGVLHSLTGGLAPTETPVVDGVLLAIEELNAAGGVLGRPVRPIVVDGRSDPETSARQAERLIREERVVTVFGCWTSACRKTVRPVFESHDHLLVYPVQYEGLEESPNILYTGAAPDQQLIPAIKWSFDRLGRRFFLVGSDYVFPRTANAIIRDQVTAMGGAIVGEAYLRLGDREAGPVVARIREARPDVILNTINGETNVAFFRALRAAGITPATIPTMSFSFAEHELGYLRAEDMVGDYAALNYFQTVDSERNRRFVASFRAKYGPDRVTSDPIESAYAGVHLWAQAVADAGVADAPAIRRAMKRQSFDAPGGMVYVEPENQHLWKVVRIGRIRADGQFDIVWSSEKPIRPVPYPIYRSREEWMAFLDGLYRGWGGAWAAGSG